MEGVEILREVANAIAFDFRERMPRAICCVTKRVSASGESSLPAARNWCNSRVPRTIAA